MKNIYGFIKNDLDAHTLGIASVADLVRGCGYRAIICDHHIAQSVSRIENNDSFSLVKKWITENRITHIGYSYRLDSTNALLYFTKLIKRILQDSEISPNLGGQIKYIAFAGLPDSCRLIKKHFNNRFDTFIGDETPVEILLRLGIPQSRIPYDLAQNSEYDNIRLEFGKSIINRELHSKISVKKNYYDCRSKINSASNLLARIHQSKLKRGLPLFRAHVGPFLENRIEALLLFNKWLNELRDTGLLDIVSIGSSQLSQANFGESWEDMPNGGGVPFNSEHELRIIAQEAHPMMLRAYSGTKNICKYAEMLDRTIENAWHALSFWWFNKLDRRGPLDLIRCLQEHFETLRYLARNNRVFEPNVPHHFAFRGADDITYIVSTYLAAKAAKLNGIKLLVFQNMLNTPRSTWGIYDLAKARVILKLLRYIETNGFKIVYQPRAGLDYFSPDLEKAKEQLAAVTCLMLDVMPKKKQFVDIIHIVSYSEGMFLATPEVINDSIRIAIAAIEHYPKFRKSVDLYSYIHGDIIKNIECDYYNQSISIIQDIERNIKNTYTPQGFYDIFKAGYLPTPYLWECRQEFPKATSWNTKLVNGSIRTVDDNGNILRLNERLSIINLNLNKL